MLLRRRWRADTKPASAAPIHLKGYPGLYGTLEDEVRTIYAPGIGHRGWWDGRQIVQTRPLLDAVIT